MLLPATNFHTFAPSSSFFFFPSHFSKSKTLSLIPSKFIVRSSVSNSRTLPESAIQRIADKLHSLGITTDQSTSTSTSTTAGEIFVPLPHNLPKHRVGHTLDPSWSTPENPVPLPGKGIEKLSENEVERQRLEKEKAREVKRRRVPTLAELSLTDGEILRLTKLGFEMKQKIKVGKAGVKEGIVNGIHERWRRSEVVRIVCEDLCRTNMKRTHDILERKTGGLVVWRSGSKIILYRGIDYKYPYFLSDNVLRDDNSGDALQHMDGDDKSCDERESHSSDMNSTTHAGQSSNIKTIKPALVQGVGAPNKVRFQLPGEAELLEEIDSLLEGLGPRFTDWWGFDPVPVDADLLPAVIPGFRHPFRLLPYGVKSNLTDDELTSLKRLGRPLPCHFALGRNRNLQGVAAAIMKLWERCEIVKIAVKRGVQNTSNKIMAEELKDLNSGKMIGSAKESGGLYYFDIGSASQLPSKTISSCFESFSVLNNKDDNIMVWHLRLGHPSFRYLKHLFPELFYNKNVASFKCEACEFAKHHRSQFSIQPYKPSKPFSIIHSDVWGPNRTSTLSLKKWFITFIDDHTRVCWVYLLKEKSDVCQTVKNFFTMVQNQFQTNIQVFRSDNGKEYFNTILDDFFLKNGIVHQSSCPNTPQQNGVAERKNRHLLEVARALLFSNKVPKYLWGEAVLTAAYLINRMPSKILNFQTPINTFKECFPSTRVLTDLTLRIFGCTAFVHEHKNVGKLEPRAIKCVFVGYSPTQKGYKCFDPKNKKMFVTMDVTFFENKPFFDDTHQGWGIKEDLFQIEDMTFLNNLSLSASQNSETYTSAPTKNGHDSLFDPTPVMSKELCESEPTFSHVENNNIPENNNSDDLIEMPQNNESLQENRFELGNGIWKGKVFVKKHHKEVDESTSQHCQESEPGNDQPPKNRKGKSISVSESRNLYPDIDDPVAIRKPVRSCTKHPMSNFISYSNLSSSLSAFTSKLSSVEIPKNVQVALEIPKWREAVLEEMKALEKNKTWSVMTLPDGKKTVGCKWVFTVKYNSDGSIERYKARLVAKGFTQTYGIDYSETFAPVAKLNTVRILLSLAANLDWPLHQLDVKNAFLNGNLEEEVYMDIPPGFENKFGSNVCKLNKSLYGLKQSPRAWFEKFTQSMKKQGYIQGQADHTLFTKFSQNGKIAVLIVYVDDIVLTGDDIVEMARLKEKLAVDFEIKDLGSMRYFLGMEVARSKNGIVVSHQKYILDLLKETGMSGCRPADTPMDPNAKIWGEGNVPVDTGRYQRLVGKLIYLSHTRPDIAFSVSVVSQFMHSPYEEHLEAVYRILRYLKGNPGKGLHFKKTSQRNVSIFTDADWAGSVTDRRSTSGYCTYVWGNLVTWRSKKQGVVARSSAEAEFRAMSQGICEGLWILRVLEELKMKIELPLKLYSDSKAAISIAHNPVQHDRTKHIEIDRHFIKEKLDAGIICLPFVTSNQQTADILTKSLARPIFEHLIDKLGMIDIYAPT